MTLAAGDVKACTITNTRKPTLKVTKLLVPTDDAGVFDLLIDASEEADDAGHNGTTGDVEVTIGGHTVSELAGTGTDLANYDSVISGDCAADGTVTLAAGDVKACTITNTRKPTLKVTKLLVPNDDTGLFNLRIDGAIATNGANKSHDEMTDAVEVTIDTHTVDETAGTSTDLANYDSVISGDCAPDGTVTVVAGENAECTITNTRIPIDPICRTPGFWGTHALENPEKDGSLNITLAVIAAGGNLSICGRTISDTEVGSVNSALEAVCVSPKGDQRLQLARQLTAAALNCVISGAGANCGGLPVIIGNRYGECNLACENDTDLDTCIEELDDFNNGMTTDPSCQEQPLVNLGLTFDPPGPAGSSEACKAATNNSTIILP